MQGNTRQLSTVVQRSKAFEQSEETVRHLRRDSASVKYRPVEVQFFCLADSNLGLHTDIQARVKSVTNSAECRSRCNVGLLELGLIPFGATNKQSELLMSAAATQALPVVVVADDLVAARRSPLPPNVVAVIANDESGAAKLRDISHQIGSHVHQKLWLVGDFNGYTQRLYQNLGYSVTCVDQLHQIDVVDECSNERASASTVVLNSSGERSYHDYDNFPAQLEEAIASNEYFSMFTLLDAQSCELKYLWQQLGVTAIDQRYTLEQEVVGLVRASLSQQHRLVTLNHDALRNCRTGIYNKNYLDEAGRLLHAASQRGETPFAVVVIQLRATDSLASVDNVEIIQNIHQLLQSELRVNDIVAQRFPEELICLISSAERYSLAGLLERVHKAIQVNLESQFGRELPLRIGATVEQGASFDAMMHRATMAALQCSLPDSGIVVIL